MKRLPILIAILITALPVAFAETPSLDANIQPEPSRIAVKPGSIGQMLHVKVGQSLFLDTEAALSRVYVDNPAIIQSYAANLRQVVLSGMAPGAGTVVLWDEHGANTAYSIVVDVNVAKLQEAYENQFPMDKIKVTSDQDTIYLRGYVSSQEEFTQASGLAKGFSKVVANSLRIAPPHQRQVRLAVKFAEVDRSKAGQLGFSLLSLGDTIAMASTGQFQAFQAPNISSAGNPLSETVNTPLNLLLYSQNMNLGAAIQDMEAKQVLQILAEPTISALSGHQGTFLAGGEFPFPMVEGGVSGQVAVSVEFMPYGVGLHFLPVVLDDGTIRLHIEPEVSALDYTNQVDIAGYSIPALSTRKAETDIAIKDGQSFALTGLLDRRLTDQFERMPGISSIPIIGQFFRSKSMQHSTSELLIFVTVHVVDELNNPSPVPAPPTPVRPFMEPKLFDQSVNGKKN